MQSADYNVRHVTQSFIISTIFQQFDYIIQNGKQTVGKFRGTSALNSLAPGRF